MACALLIEVNSAYQLSMSYPKLGLCASLMEESRHMLHFRHSLAPKLHNQALQNYCPVATIMASYLLAEEFTTYLLTFTQ